MIPLGEDRPAPVFPVSVYLLIAVNAYVFFTEVTAPNFPRFVNSFATIPYDVTHGVTLPPPSPGSALWTLITAQFMHANLLHIFFNMLFLFVFGPDAVFDNRGQIAEQSLEAVYFQSLVGLPGGSFAPGGVGSPGGGDDGSAGRLCLWLIVIVEEHGGQ